MKKIISALTKGAARETVSYVFFGGLTTALGVGLFALFFRLGFSAAVSNTFSTVAAVLFAFVTNKVWVFRSGSFAPALVLAELVKFAAGRLFTYALETAALYALVDRLGLHGGAMKLITTVVVIALNYFISKKAVFIK